MGERKQKKKRERKRAVFGGKVDGERLRERVVSWWAIMG